RSHGLGLVRVVIPGRNPQPRASLVQHEGLWQPCEGATLLPAPSRPRQLTPPAISSQRSIWGSCNEPPCGCRPPAKFGNPRSSKQVNRPHRASSEPSFAPKESSPPRLWRCASPRGDPHQSPP